MRRLILVFVALACPAAAQHVTGIGGVFVKSPDPKALAAWYQTVLGLTIEPWGGAVLHYDASQHPPAAAWTPLRAASTYTTPSTRDFMIDLTVDDMDAMIARLAAHHVGILKRDDSDSSGHFAWIMDPDGTKIELWQPVRH